MTSRNRKYPMVERLEPAPLVERDGGVATLGEDPAFREKREPRFPGE